MDSKARLSMAMAAAAIVCPGMAVAQDSSRDGLADVERFSIADMVDREYTRTSEMHLQTNWDFGGLAITGARHRTGRRRDCERLVCAEWYRDYAASAQGWVALDNTIALTASYDAAREHRGTERGPLLTLPTRGLRQSVALGVQRHDDALKLVAFDQPGWTDTEPADVPRRLANGEGRARRGMALRYETARLSGATNTHLAFSLERADTIGGSTETLAQVSLQGTF